MLNMIQSLVLTLTPRFPKAKAGYLQGVDKIEKYCIYLLIIIPKTEPVLSMYAGKRIKLERWI